MPAPARAAHVEQGVGEVRAHGNAQRGHRERLAGDRHARGIRAPVHLGGGRHVVHADPDLEAGGDLVGECRLDVDARQLRLVRHVAALEVRGPLGRQAIRREGADAHGEPGAQLPRQIARGHRIRGLHQVGRDLARAVEEAPPRSDQGHAGLEVPRLGASDDPRRVEEDRAAPRARGGDAGPAARHRAGVMLVHREPLCPGARREDERGYERSRTRYGTWPHGVLQQGGKPTEYEWSRVCFRNEGGGYGSRRALSIIARITA